MKLVKILVGEAEKNVPIFPLMGRPRRSKYCFKLDELQVNESRHIAFDPKDVSRSAVYAAIKEHIKRLPCNKYVLRAISDTSFRVWRIK